MVTPVHPPTQIRFCQFVLDLTSGELYKGNKKIALPPKAFEVLSALAEHPGQVVTREELQDRLWATNTFVEFDDGLNHAVKNLRHVLGDSAEKPQFIETLPRHGYRFVAKIEQEEVPDSGPMNVWRRRRKYLVAGAILLVVLFLLLAFDTAGWKSRFLGRTPIRSIAVLPLANLSGDSQQDYFAEGMTDALIADLAKIRSLKVISRTSVMQFTDSRKPLPEIARALNVDAILEGSVQRSAGRVKVIAHLIRARTDTHIWAATYERDTRDVLPMQSELAQAVVREIKVVVTPEESKLLSRARPINPEAYEDYLKGQAAWHRMSREHFDAALGYFQLALEKDPAYAPAEAGVANIWMLRGDSGILPPAEAFPRAKEAALRALRLDDSLADAHIVYANIVGPYDRDWRTAEREFRRALELNPNSADGHFMYSDYLISMKRVQEWEPEIQRTLELDPFNPFYQCFYGWHLVYLGRYDDAIAQLQKASASEPDFSAAHMGLWGAYFKKGMRREALAEARKFYASLRDQDVQDALIRGETEGGYRQAMQRAAEALDRRSKYSYVSAVRIARLYAHAENREETLRCLRIAFDRHETPLTHLGVAWDWDFLRSAPQFQDLVRRAGLPR